MTPDSAQEGSENYLMSSIKSVGQEEQTAVKNLVFSGLGLRTAILALTLFKC